MTADSLQQQPRSTQRGFSPRRWVLLCLGLVLTLVSVLALSAVYVRIATHNQRYDALASAPQERVAIVFGAAVYPNEQLSPMLADRVDEAIELYRAGKTHKLLMTGDNSQVEYNEVEAMRRYAVAHGVPDEAITLDYAGFRTYDSCYRAHAIFGVTDAILVTQRYHLPRAIYTCNQLGIRAVGVGTPDWGRYSPLLMAQYSLRETIATLVALLEVHITQPLPTFLGKFEGMR